MRDKIYLEKLVDSASRQRPIKATSFKDRLIEVVDDFAEGIARAIDEDIISDADAISGPIHACQVSRAIVAGNASIYRINDRFGEHLNRTLLAIPTSVIPYTDNKYYCIEFPKPFHDEKTGDYHRSAIVWMGVINQLKSNYKNINIGMKDCKKGITFIFPDYDKKGDLTDTQTYVRLDPTSGPTIEDIVQRQVEHHDGCAKDHIQAITAFTMKCLLYIESGDPDLIPEHPKPLLTKNPKKMRRYLKENLPMEVVNVGYGLHRRHYTSDSSLVSGHYRWQAYGPGRTQVKLIWIEEHTRKYQTEGRN